MALANRSSSKKNTVDSGALLKWLIIAALALLFIVGIIVMVDDRAAQQAIDPREAMLREMGLDPSTPVGGPPPPPESPLGKALGQLGSSNPNERVAGINAAMEIDPTAAWATVRLYLADPAPPVRAATASALAAKKIPQCGAQIVHLLSDPDPGARQAAVAALQAAYTHEAGLLQQLRTPLSSRDPEVVKAGIEVWKKVAVTDISNAARIIEGPLYSEDDRILPMAIEALTFLGPENIGALKPRLESIASRRAGTPIGESAKAILDSFQTP
jgi:hypothetical protein